MKDLKLFDPVERFRDARSYLEAGQTLLAMDLAEQVKEWIKDNPPRPDADILIAACDKLIVDAEAAIKEWRPGNVQQKQ